MNQAMRAVPLAPSAPADVRSELLGLEALLRHREAWDSLAEGAAYPNPHFSHRAIAAHVESAIGARDLRFVAVWRGEELVALLPYRPKGARIGWLRSAASPFTSPFVTNATPLVSGEALEPAIDALAHGLALACGPDGVWRLPLLAVHSPVGEALLAALARRGFGHELVGSFERAVLNRRTSYDDFARTLGRRAKDLRRRRKRLGEQGQVEHRAVVADPEFRAALESFLVLERAGWKGARGTALACRPETAAFARRLFSVAPGPVTSRADILTLDGRPVAVSLALVCGGTACLLKTAYDENLRSFAPGLLLEDDIVRAAHETRFADRLDSASAADSVLEGLYPDRETITDVLVATTPGRDLGPLRRAEQRRQEMRGRAKALLRRIRPR